MSEAIILYRGRGGVNPELLKPTTITQNGIYEAPVTGTYQVSCVGGGGGGGGGCISVSSPSTRYYGAAGSRGSRTIKNISLNKGDKITCNLGNGGSAGANNTIIAFDSSRGTNGGAGATTTFGSYASASGGSGGGGSWSRFQWNNTVNYVTGIYQVEHRIDNAGKYMKPGYILGYEFITKSNSTSFPIIRFTANAYNANDADDTGNRIKYCYGFDFNKLGITQYQQELGTYVNTSYNSKFQGNWNFNTSVNVAIDSFFNLYESGKARIVTTGGWSSSLYNGLYPGRQSLLLWNKSISNWENPRLNSSNNEEFSYWFKNNPRWNNIRRYWNTANSYIDYGNVKLRDQGSISYQNISAIKNQAISHVFFITDYELEGMTVIYNTYDNVSNYPIWNNRSTHYTSNCKTSISVGSWWYLNNNAVSTSGTRTYRGDGGNSGRAGNAGFVLIIPPQL